MRNKIRATIRIARDRTKSLRRLCASMSFLVLLLCAACQDQNRQVVSPAGESHLPGSTGQPLTGFIVNADQVTESNIAQWRQSHVTVVLNLTTVDNREVERRAAASIQTAGLELDYFIEVGRCPELAIGHPEWMASLQGHPEWQQRFPEVPVPTNRQVIKNFPWVPILYQESFAAHLDRIKNLLADKPAPQRVWLNDLQGAPSACGCGHPLCRWTADYGPIKTATPLGQQAAADFVKQVRAITGTAEVIPIFVGECEAGDKDTVCCGVSCFEGKCWKDFTKQLDFLSHEAEQIGVACFYQLFERDLERYGKPAGWVSYTLNSFSEMPRLREGQGVATDRLIAVLQGWNVTEAQIESQVRQAKHSHAAGWLIALAPIDQSWEPVLFDLPPETADAPVVQTSDPDHEYK